MSDDELLSDLRLVANQLARNTVPQKIYGSVGKYDYSTLIRRFGSWTAALENFVDYANSGEADSEAFSVSAATTRKRTGRGPSLRLRFKVLQRDRFTCQHCGASPAKTIGVDLHVDHMVPWSKGGETTMENLQTLCSSCNLGKSNLEPDEGTLAK